PSVGGAPPTAPAEPPRRLRLVGSDRGTRDPRCAEDDDARNPSLQAGRRPHLQIAGVLADQLDLVAAVDPAQFGRPHVIRSGRHADLVIADRPPLDPLGRGLVEAERGPGEAAARARARPRLAAP